jgi:hypothetical protein
MNILTKGLMQAKILLIICFSISCTQLFSQKFYNATGIREVRLTFPNDNWDKFLDSAKTAHSEARLTGTLMVEGQRFENVGVRYKGNSSYYGTRKRGVKKLPFNIKLPKGQLLEGKYETLKLSNVSKDASFVREALSYEIIGTYMPAPKANFAKVFINEKLQGFYSNVESIDEHFAKNRLNTEGYLVKCDPEWDVKIPTACPVGDKASLMYVGEDSICYAPIYEMDKHGSWREFINFVKILNQEPDKIERVLNVDQTLWMLALNNVMGNLDSYNGLLSHNYYLYRTPDGRFTPIMWDLNLSFGGFMSESTSSALLTVEQMQNYQPLKDLDNPKRPLIAQILKKETYRKIYIAHIRTILNDWFVNGRYAQRARELAQIIDSQVNSDKNKHYSYDEFKKNMTESVGSGESKIVGIEELMVKRIAFLKTHPLILRVPPKIENTPTAFPSNRDASTVSEDKLTIKVKITGATRAFCCVRNDAHQPYRYLPMFDDGLHNDDAAGDGVFGVVMDKKTTFEYYIMAENEDAVSLFPERAGFEFLTYKF